MVISNRPRQTGGDPSTCVWINHRQEVSKCTGPPAAGPALSSDSAFSCRGATSVYLSSCLVSFKPECRAVGGAGGGSKAVRSVGEGSRGVGRPGRSDGPGTPRSYEWRRQRRQERQNTPQRQKGFPGAHLLVQQMQNKQTKLIKTKLQSIDQSHDTQK